MANAFMWGQKIYSIAQNKKIMKIRLILYFCIFYSTNLLAQSVGIDEARQKALQFLSTKSTAANSRGIVSKPKDLKLAYQASLDNGQNAYYIFNNDAGGFVIVSGDDRAENILGYSNNGAFEIANIPDNMRGWLNEYATQIKYLKGHQLTASNYRQASTYAAISPLLTTTWDQYAPYNLRCPKRDGGNCVTGCGATAIAQVMRYYQWPQDYTNEIPAYGSSLQYEALPPIKFDWEHMKDSYGDNDTEEEQNAVADLMLYCGHAAQTSYGINGSGSDSMYYLDALVKLGYSKSVELRSREDCSTEQWEELVYNELAEGRPVIYSGRRYYHGKSTGHSFVCDGYDGNGFFHINWGWGGLVNGYFRLQALNPLLLESGYYSDKDYLGGYSVNQNIIVGISPTEINREPFNGLSTDWLYVTGEEWNWERIEEQIYDYNRENGLSNVRLCYRAGLTPTYFMYRDEGYDMGLGLFHKNELIDVLVCYEPIPLDDVWTYSNWYLKGIGMNLSDGIYDVKGIGRKHGTELWQLNRDSDLSWVQIEVKGNKVTAKSVSVGGQVAIMSVKQILDDKIKKGKIVRLTIRNTGNAQMSPFFTLYLDDENIMSEGAWLMPGETDYIDFIFKADSGTHHLILTEGYYTETTMYDMMFFLVDSDHGDVNGDGIINAEDIVEVVNFIKGNPSDKFIESAADMNGDGVVNAADIEIIMDFIMAKK